MDLTVASGFKSKPAFRPSEVADVPERSPQVEGPLSPAPDQHSPSAAPSVGLTFPPNYVTELDGVRISSTSPPSSPLTKDSEQQHPREMYDPFSPTDAEKEERATAVAEDEEKYDPFDPTGSPVSDNDISTEELKNQEVENQVKSDKTAAKKMVECVEEPPDSTDTLADSPKPRLALLSLRRTVDCSTIKEELTDSEHSEIEEGEIVGLADREAGLKHSIVESISVNSPSSTFFGSKPERILRVLDGDGFVSVRADPDWPVNIEPEEEPVVGVEDLRRKLVSRRKERYITFPGSSITLTTEASPPSGHLHSPPPTPPPAPLKEDSKTCKSSKNSNDRDRQKSKDGKSGGKEERRKKKRKEKRSQHKSKEKQDPKIVKESKSKGSSRSRSAKRKKRQQESSEGAAVEHLSQEHSRNKPRDTSRQTEKDREKDRDRDRDKEHSRDKNRSLEQSRDRNRERSRDRHRERDRSRERNRDKERSRERERDRDRDRYWDRHHDRDQHHRSQRTDEGDSRAGRKRGHDSRSRERDSSKRSKRSSERNEGDHERRRDRERDRDRDGDRERRRDGRPVVPPSIQDLNGSDLFAIKRTITVTTTTTTTTVPGSPRLGSASPSRSPQNIDKSHRKKKRKGRLSPDERGRTSRSRSLSPPRYHNYESDRYSDKLDIDVLSLDGEALDSDYPSLEDTPPPPPPPPLPSPKTKPTSKSGQLKRKSLKKNSETSRTKNKSLTSATSDCAPVSSGLPVVKRMRKVKDKTRDKGSRKELGRSGKSKKDGTTSRKAKLQSKVSVLVREGVSSTTGSSGKLGMDLLGTGGPGGGAGSSVVGGSIAVVFCRDNESRSPFLKPCSEPLPLSLGGRGKDLSSMGKRNSLNTLPSMNSPAVLPSQKAKPGSITSTSSSASSPSSSLVTKRRRRLVKKTREKGGAVGSKAEESGQGATSAWARASTEPPATSGDVCKAASPHPGPAGSVPCSSSSSSSSTSVLPPSSSPPPSPPPSAAPMRDMRESSPDSQTVDSSCKTPEPSFLVEECPSQTSPTTPPSSSPSLMPTSLGSGLNLTPTDPPKPCSPPPCPSSSAGLSSMSLDPSSSSVSSSSANKPPPPPPAASTLPWSLQTGVDCTAGGVLALTALLFKMEEANIASRAKAQEFIQATSQILSQANQNQPTPMASTQVPPPPSLPPPPRVSPTQYMLHNSSHLHPCAQTPPPFGLSGFSGSSGDSGWDNDSKDPDKYLKKLHTQERAVEEVKLAIKPYYQRKDINKDEYKDILRKAVHKICHSRTGEINPVKVSNLVKLYVQRYKYFRKHGRKMDDDRDDREPGGLHSSV